MDWSHDLFANWPVRLVCALLILAAYIDGKQLRVPNWLTFSMVLSGLAYSTWAGGWAGLGDGLLGMVVGLACLLPLYAVGGMGAGDVKLLAGVGAWLGATTTFYAFCVSTIVGAVMAVAMVVWRKSFDKHYAQLLMILSEWMTIKNPRELSRIAAERKPKMLLLPYGIPICVGSIAYFFYEGMI
ncbi:MAG TPA: A24 family peptidase [Planctomycetaceae bacterium]|jgi:prepilin peptidase CpaA|nr:A24 family peptidase [Planctomycetaceae bacterium]